MTLNLISTAKVKEQLGITSTTYDVQIAGKIPIVSADVRRILNNQFNVYYAASFSAASTLIDLGMYTVRRYEETAGFAATDINIGQVVYSPYLPDDTYISAFDPLTGFYTLSATPTGTGTYIYPSVSVAQWPTIAKMVWYKIDSGTTENAGAQKVRSESFGPVSKTYADSEINRQWDYPQTLIDDLGVPYARAY